MSGRMKENNQHGFTKSKSYQSNLIACYKWQDLYMGREHWVSFILASSSKAGLPSGEPKQTGGKSWQEPCEVQQGPQPYPVSGKEELLMLIDGLLWISPGSPGRKQAVHEVVVWLCALGGMNRGMTCLREKVIPLDSEFVRLCLG